MYISIFSSAEFLKFFQLLLPSSVLRCCSGGTKVRFSSVEPRLYTLARQSPKDWENNSIIIVMIGRREKKETAIDRTMDDSPERDE